MKPDLALHTWNLTRVLRLLAGIVFFVMGIVDGPWLLSAAALVLIYQGVYNAGCAWRRLVSAFKLSWNTKLPS